MNKIWKRAWQVRSKLPKVEFRTSVVWGVCGQHMWNVEHSEA